MNKLARARLSTLFTCLVCIMLALPAQSAAPWFSGFTDRVLREGHEALLPPHLALVLGLGTGEKAVAVKQLAVQKEQQIHTFNVCTDKGRMVVVILDYDPETRITKAFLVGSGAKLQRAVSYETGAQPTPLSGAPARIALQKELHYWSDRAAAP
jgi:hypothetical protein